MKTKRQTIDNLIQTGIAASVLLHQRINLAKLALILKDKKKSNRFDMACFFINKKEGGINDERRHTPSVINRSKLRHECGTSACAVGWGGIHGIGEINPNMSWLSYMTMNYCSDLFQRDAYDEKFDEPSNSWRATPTLSDFMFGSGLPNVPSYAAKRIAFFLLSDKYVIGREKVDFLHRNFRPNWHLIEVIASGNEIKAQ